MRAIVVFIVFLATLLVVSWPALFKEYSAPNVTTCCVRPAHFGKLRPDSPNGRRAYAEQIVSRAHKQGGACGLGLPCIRMPPAHVRPDRSTPKRRCPPCSARPIPRCE